MVVTSIKDIHMEGGDKSKVKNTVALFEEKVHATEADHVTRLQLGSKPRGEVEFLTTKLEKVTLELKETKQNLEKSVEEGMVMATCLSILHKELEQTKQELQELKEKDLYFRYRSSPGPSDEVWVEKDVQHVVDEPKVEVMPIMKQKEEFEFQKNDVTFANEPSITKYIVPDENPVLVRLPSLKSTKKKKPLIAGIFSRRKGSKENTSLEEFDYREQIWS